MGNYTLIIGPADGANIAERPVTEGEDPHAPGWLERAGRSLAADAGVTTGTALVAYLYNDDEEDLDNDILFTA